jgi:ABC-type spermidine/putrescine transport system permease subunit II
MSETRESSRSEPASTFSWSISLGSAGLGLGATLGRSYGVAATGIVLAGAVATLIGLILTRHRYVDNEFSIKISCFVYLIWAIIVAAALVIHYCR